MRVFVSWSGARSKAVAEVLRVYIERMIQNAKPWMSDRDIGSGQMWFNEISAELERSDFGVCVITAENQSRPWVHFEAGALAKNRGQARVVPLLVDLDVMQLKGGPLTQFQVRTMEKGNLLRLLRDINAELPPEHMVQEENLKALFEDVWPKWDAAMQEAVRANPPEDPRDERSSDEMLAEILEISRGLMRASQSAPALPRRGQWRAQRLPGGATYLPIEQPELRLAIRELMNATETERLDLAADSLGRDVVEALLRVRTWTDAMSHLLPEVRQKLEVMGLIDSDGAFTAVGKALAWLLDGPPPILE